MTGRKQEVIAPRRDDRNPTETEGDDDMVPRVLTVEDEPDRG